MNTTVTVQIGNSDNKLSQVEWSRYISSVSDVVGDYSIQVHFSGGSSYDMPWQNACFVAEVAPGMIESLQSHLTEIRKQFGQDSIAITFGDTSFI